MWLVFKLRNQSKPSTPHHTSAIPLQTPTNEGRSRGYLELAILKACQRIFPLWLRPSPLPHPDTFSQPTLPIKIDPDSPPRENSLLAFASPILGAPVVSLLRSALHTEPSGRRPLRTDTVSLRLIRRCCPGSIPYDPLPHPFRGILGAPVVSLLRSALHTEPSGRRPLRTDIISLIRRCRPGSIPRRID